MENENTRYFSFLRSSATNVYQNPIIFILCLEIMKLLKFLKISGKVENNLMVWSFGFFCSLTFLKNIDKLLSTAVKQCNGGLACMRNFYAQPPLSFLQRRKQLNGSSI